MLSRQKLGTFLLNKVLQNYKKWKNVIDKSCSTIHILGRENHFRKDLVEFWHWKLTLNIEKCRFSRVFNQTVLQGIKKSSGHVYWDVKSYWISYASLWNSTTVITLINTTWPWRLFLSFWECSFLIPKASTNTHKPKSWSNVFKGGVRPKQFCKKFWGSTNQPSNQARLASQPSFLSSDALLKCNF